MNIQILVHIGLLYFVEKMKLFISIASVLNIFLKKLKNLLKIKTITNSFRIQAYDSIMCGYFCMGFINFMLAGKKFSDYTNLFSPHDLKKMTV